MKFGLLYIPDYYPDRYKSASHYYGEMMEQIQYEEELGFEGVFFAEHYSVRAGIQPGVKVTKDTVLYDMHGQCVEMGWATADGSGSLGWSELDYHEGELSAIGLNMDQLVRSTGGPAGLILGRPTSGHLPPGWPTI